MIIDLSTITSQPRHYHFAFEKDWWLNDANDEQIQGLDAPLQVDVDLYRAGAKFVLEGKMIGRLRIRCDRCLEPYGQDLKKAFTLILTALTTDSDQEEIELSDEDLLTDFIEGDEIELDDFIREQIYLALPIKCLCDENCAGICPDCGANLNSEPCSCQREKGHPAFLKLKHVKIKGE